MLLKLEIQCQCLFSEAISELIIQTQNIFNACIYTWTGKILDDSSLFLAWHPQTNLPM